MAYYSVNEITDRLKAQAGDPKYWISFFWAFLMFWAVRLFGGPYWPFSWRWGFGYDDNDNNDSSR